MPPKASPVASSASSSRFVPAAGDQLETKAQQQERRHLSHGVGSPGAATAKRRERRTFRVERPFRQSLRQAGNKRMDTTKMRHPRNRIVFKPNFSRTVQTACVQTLLDGIWHRIKMDKMMLPCFLQRRPHAFQSSIREACDFGWSPVERPHLSPFRQDLIGSQRTLRISRTARLCVFLSIAPFVVKTFARQTEIEGKLLAMPSSTKDESRTTGRPAMPSLSGMGTDTAAFASPPCRR